MGLLKIAPVLFGIITVSCLSTAFVCLFSFLSSFLPVGVVAVYVLNDEFKSIQREAQNGMSRASTYLIAKAVLVLPILFMFALVSLVSPSMVIQGIPWSALGLSMMLHASLMFVFESFAEMLSVALDNPILGMLGHVAFWFGGFLFGGFRFQSVTCTCPLNYFFMSCPLDTIYEVSCSLPLRKPTGYRAKT